MYRIGAKLDTLKIRIRPARAAEPTMKEASLTSALFLHGYGCFVPDLTSFTAEPCEGARQQLV